MIMQRFLQNYLSFKDVSIGVVSLFPGSFLCIVDGFKLCAHCVFCYFILFFVGVNLRFQCFFAVYNMFLCVFCCFFL